MRRGWRSSFIGVAILALLTGLLPLVGPAPSAHAVRGQVSFVAASSIASNRTAHMIAVPEEVQAGDMLILYLTINTNAATINHLGGWMQIQTYDAEVRGRVYTKAATAADAGTTVTVTTTVAAKSVLGIAAYRSTGLVTIVSAQRAVTYTGTSSFLAPTVSVANEDSRLVHVWTEKSSTNLSWTVPAETTLRTRAAGTGSGKISGVLADETGVAAGSSPARAATTSAAAGRGIVFSVVITPGEIPGTRAPTAVFTADCSGLSCEVNAGASSDPDGDQLSYAWDFGDGQSGTGVATEHTYVDDGPRTVTLTVSDGQSEHQTDRQVTPSAAIQQGSVSFVAAASTDDNSLTHSVNIPNSVRPGDRLLLFLNVNTATGTLTDPAPGWTLLQSATPVTARGRVWTRMATDTDPGSEIIVRTSERSKSVMTVAAYRSTGAPVVSASAARWVNSAASEHPSATVAVAKTKSWLVNYWAEKSSTTPTFTLPNGVTSRSTATSTGSGKVSSILGDSASPVPVGIAGPRTATTSAPASRLVSFSIVINPGTIPPG